MSENESDRRFIALETKVAYQEKLISDLNDVILSRGREIDALVARIVNLEKVFREDPGSDPGNEPPPHY